MAFDLLMVDGQDVMREPWKDRRKQLEDLFTTLTLPRVGLVPVTEDAATLYETWVGWGGEGIVLKGSAIGVQALLSNTTGEGNTGIGIGADVSPGNLVNATAIGAGAIVNASNKIRLGNSEVTVIEGPVAYTFPSDQTRKENFQPVDGEEVLRKLRGLSVTSWNYIGHDSKTFRHYGPMGQAFFAAFGQDGIGTIGSPTTLTSSDVAGILMSAVQALEKRTVELGQTVEMLKAENAQLKARLEQPFASSVAARP